MSTAPPKRQVSPIGLCLIVLLLWFTEAPAAGISGDLVVFHAGSLSVPFKEIAEAFNKDYPDVKVLSEAAGSRACARKITDLDRSCDVLASADYGVIDTLLIPEYAEWNVKFAGNEMAIVYQAGSRRANEISAQNWYDILLDPEVAFGRSDPNADPCGYRTAILAKLAEQFYKKQGLAARLLEKDLRYMRPKETDLLALLETKAIDYIFLYRSVAVQHGLLYVTLPDEINLKNPDLAAYYRTATTEVSGEKPGETTTIRGEPIVYGVTIPRNAENPRAAVAFVAFLLDKNKGMAIMEKHGQASLVPCLSESIDRLPEPLRAFVVCPREQTPQRRQP